MFTEKHSTHSRLMTCVQQQLDFKSKLLLLTLGRLVKNKERVSYVGRMLFATSGSRLRVMIPAVLMCSILLVCSLAGMLGC